MRIWLLVLLLSGLALGEPDFSSPEAAYQTYLAACQSGDFGLADLCYTHSSRQYLAENPKMTEGRSPEILTGTYVRLKDKGYRVEQVSERRAIIRWDPEDPRVPPIYIRQQKRGEGWRLDLMFMARYIRQHEDGWSFVIPQAEKLWKKGS